MSFIYTYLGLNVATPEESSDEAGVGPITPKEDFDLESRPFLQAVFKVLDCRENDYLVLFGICLLRAIQGNEGKFNFASPLFLCFGFGQYLFTNNVFQCIFRVLQGIYFYQTNVLLDGVLKLDFIFGFFFQPVIHKSLKFCTICQLRPFKI